MIIDTIFLFLWAALPIVWHYLLKAAGLSILRLTIPSFVLLALYLYQYVGLPALYFHLDEHRAGAVTDQWIVFRVFLYTAITMTLMIAGYIAGRRVFGQLDWVRKNNISYSNTMQQIGLLGLFSICLIVLFMYLSKIGFEQIAIVNVLGLGADTDPSFARSIMTNDFEGKYHWYSLFMQSLLTFCAYGFFAQYLLKRNFKNRLLLGIIFFTTAFSLIAAIEKGPLTNFLITLFLVYVLLKKDGRIPIKQGLFFATFLLIVALIMVANFMGIEDSMIALSSMVSRVFTGQIQPAYHYLEFFPHQIDFLYGRSFPNPGGLLPFEPYRLTVEVMYMYKPALLKMGVVGSMPTIYWGEMYANFGFIGVLLPPFFVGFVLYWINSLIFRLRPDPLSIALFVFCVMHFMALYGSSLSNFFFDIYLFGVVFFFFLIRLISRRGISDYPNSCSLQAD